MLLRIKCVRIFQNKKVHVFTRKLIKLINEHAVMNLIIILRIGKFFSFLKTILDKSVSLLHIA